MSQRINILIYSKLGVDHFFQDILLNYFNLQLKDASHLLTLLFIIDVF